LYDGQADLKVGLYGLVRMAIGSVVSDAGALPSSDSSLIRPAVAVPPR
jgi:hypothetical protein